MQHYIRSATAAFFLLIIQTTFIPYIGIEGITPDLLTIWVIYTAVRRGQFEATVSGFAAGLAQDLLATHFLGLAALSKTIMGFVCGYFFNENKTTQTLGTYRFISLTLSMSFLHNAVYFFIFFQGLTASFLLSVVEFSIGSTLYTALLSSFVMFYSARQQMFGASL